MKGSQIVEDNLIDNFSRQANITRSNRVRRGTHQRTTPMRGRARDVGDAMRTRSKQKIAGRFFGRREHERCAAHQRAQEDLQAAVPTDVVEGAPDERVARAAALYRAGEA